MIDEVRAATDIAVIKISPARDDAIIGLLEEGRKLKEFAVARTIARDEDLKPATSNKEEGGKVKMFRYEIGATILVSKYSIEDHEPTEVKILAKAPNTIKVEILSDGWFKRGDIRILSGDTWYAIGRIKEAK